jgi:curved DNA-binding protein CbpA
MSESDSVDYYELLQISPNAEPETVHQVYNMLAQRHHPDNPETGDTERFVLLNQAFNTLSDPQLRGSYDAAVSNSLARRLLAYAP